MTATTERRVVSRSVSELSAVLLTLDEALRLLREKGRRWPWLSTARAHVKMAELELERLLDTELRDEESRAAMRR